MLEFLQARHIQDHASATNFTYHWGYASRVVPCANDAGSCEYLDQVYAGHDLSIVYSWILWLVLAGVALLWFALRAVSPRNGYASRLDTEAGAAKAAPGFMARLFGASHALRRKYLLPESLRLWFGRVSRLQLVILAIISAYLLIFSFVGMEYRHWITPIKNSTKKNTRSTLGPWSDRIGIIAYAITPFCVALATRESVLSIITGIPYQHFNFLHRWTGRIIYVQSTLHTIAWTIIEAKLYQPQPKVYRDFIQQQYMIFGCVAMLLVSWLFFMSFSFAIKWTGYEFFRKTHYIAAVLYIGACIGHWQQLWPYLVPAYVLWFVDRGVRLLRTAIIHFGKKDPVKGFGFHSAKGRVTTFSDEDSAVSRVEFEFPHAPWAVGQHFHLCFPHLTVWQSHPMTPLSSPTAGTVRKHVYVIRAFKGETARLAAIAAPVKDYDEKSGVEGSDTTSVILTGPSGGDVFRRAGSQTPVNVFAIAGGTGISFALPTALEGVRRAETFGAGSVTLVWVIRHIRNVEWIAPELEALRERLVSSGKVDFQMKLFITRDSQPSSRESLEETIVHPEKLDIEKPERNLSISMPKVSIIDSIVKGEIPGFSIKWLGDHHPNFDATSGVDGEASIIDEWLQRGAVHGGSFHVFASGPAAMGTALRNAVAKRNDPSAVWAGRSEGDVEYYWDDRFG